MDSSSKEPSPTEKEWGAALADILEQNFPNIANAVRPGVGADCAQFFLAIQTGDEAANASMNAFCQALNGAMTYLIGSNAVTEEQLTQVQRENSELQQELATKVNMNERLTDALLGKSTPTGTGTRKSKDPEKFSGSEKDITKRQQEYVNWRSQVNRCLGVDKAIFNSEYLRIQFVASLLTGPAYEVNQLRFDTITTHEHDPERWHWKTTGVVFQDLNSQFEILDLSQQARQALDNLYMANKPFPNFLVEFETLAARCGVTEEQKVEKLRVKVSRELSDEITHRVDRPDKADFTAWTALYQKIWQNLEEQKHVDKLRENRPGAKPRHSLNHNQQAHPGAHAAANQNTSNNTQETGDPMVLDAMGRPPRPSARPSREECLAQDLCFYCKKPGHTKQTCREKQLADAKWAGWNPANPARRTPNSTPNNQLVRQPYGPGGFQGQAPRQSWANNTRPPSTANYQNYHPQSNGYFPQNQYNPSGRFRHLETGFVESATTSPEPSVMDGSERPGTAPLTENE